MGHLPAGQRVEMTCDFFPKEAGGLGALSSSSHPLSFVLKNKIKCFIPGSSFHNHIE